MTDHVEAYGIGLFLQHAALLRDSAISPETARARPYRTVDTKTSLIKLGFSPAQVSVPGLLIPLHDKVGNTIGFQYRPDQPRQRDGKPIKYETPPGQKNRIDVPPGVGEVLDDPAVDLWITEGARKADAATELGLACVSLSGVWNWRGSNDKGGKVAIPDWDDIALNGRTVVLAFDSDTASKPSVRQALDRLAAYLDGKGAVVRVCQLPESEDGKTGLDDYIAAGHDRDDLTALVVDRSTAGVAASAQAATKESAATVLVRLALDNYRLGVTGDGEPFALPLSGAPIVRLLRGGRASLRGTLAESYYTNTGKVAPAQALTEALTTLEGRAQLQQPEQLALRVATHEGAYYLDLGDPTGRAVRIDGSGWNLVDRAPVLFRRTELTGPLPVPVQGGSLTELWDLINVTDADRPLLLALMISILIPDIPHPVLALRGEQGSGKSTCTKMLAALLDPSPAQYRKAPRDVESWVTAAAGSWVVAVDNVSTVQEWWSDSLCRAVTGDGDVRRRLYSDAGLTVFSFRRVVLLNGIDLGAVRDDLAERLLTIELQRINDHGRRLEADLVTRWAEAHPRVLGALLDLAVQVFTTLPDIALTQRPRMADFANILAAVDDVLGTTGLLSYTSQARDLAVDAVEADAVLTAIVNVVRTPWQGTAGDLLGLITPTDLAWRRPKDWPTTKRDMTALLRRRAPSLRKLGWSVEDLKRGGRDKVVRFSIVPPSGRSGAGDNAGVDASSRASTASRRATPAGIAGRSTGGGPAETASSEGKTGDTGDLNAASLSCTQQEEVTASSAAIHGLTGRTRASEAPASPAPHLALGPCGRCRRTEVIRYGEHAEPVCSACRPLIAS